MARIFITGSSDGIGSLAAQALVKRKHQVILHARNKSRAEDAKAACPGAEAVLIGDLTSLSETKALANEVNKRGPLDAVIHNAGLYRGAFRPTAEGYASIFAVNTLAPYLLTCLIQRPERLVYVSSGMHRSGRADVQDLTWSDRRERGWNDVQAYSDSKLHNNLLAAAVARKWPDVQSNSVDPGWVPTKMGGASATDDIQGSVDAFVMLVEGTGNAKGVTGKYFSFGKVVDGKAVANDAQVQDNFLKAMKEISGVELPA